MYETKNTKGNFESLCWYVEENWKIFKLCFFSPLLEKFSLNNFQARHTELECPHNSRKPKKFLHTLQNQRKGSHHKLITVVKNKGLQILLEMSCMFYYSHIIFRKIRLWRVKNIKFSGLLLILHIFEKSDWLLWTYLEGSLDRKFLGGTTLTLTSFQ